MYMQNIVIIHVLLFGWQQNRILFIYELFAENRL